MAKQDVQLVIRARNEATKALDQINKALDLLNEKQGQVVKSAAGANAALDKSADSYRKLSATAKKETADTAAKVAAAYGQIEQAVTKAGGALSKQQGDFKESKAVLASLEGQIARAQTAIVSLALEMRQAGDPSGKLATKLALAQQALKNLSGDAEKTRKAVATQKQAVDAASTEFDALTRSATAAAVAVAAANRAIASGEARAARLASLAQTRAIRDQSGFGQFDRTARTLRPSAASRGPTPQEVAVQIRQQQLLASRAVNEASGFRNLTGQIERAEAAAKRLKAVADGAAYANKQARALAVKDAIRARERSDATGFAAFTRRIEEQARAERDLAAATREAAKAAREAALAQAQKVRAGSGFGAFDASVVRQQAELARQQALAARQAALAQSRATNAGSGFRQFEANVSRAAVVGAGRPADTANIRDVLRLLAGLPRAVDPAANAMRRAAGEATNLRRVLGAFYGDSRKALSFFQRLRGEVLSMAASFAGLYAAIEGGRGVAQAYMTLEAAQSRLGAVFSQNTDLVGREIRWLQEEASRLGISFGTLSDEYSKFAVATQAAGYANDTTREIFIRVAEAARVNKLSVEQVSGVMLALQQMISKGKVSSEELRRQMGDRLPGAFNIFANAIGMTTAELDKALQQGEVFATQDNMLAFADELNKRFGAQLPAALQTFTAQWGKFQNNVFGSQLIAGQGGLIDGMTAALERLNTFFESESGKQFFADLGNAAGKLLQIVPILVENFDLLFAAFKGFVVLKLGQVFAALFVNMAQTNAALVTTRGALLAASIQLNMTAGAASAAAAGFVRAATSGTVMSGVLLRIAAAGRAMWIAIGGPVGLIATVISFFAVNVLGGMLTSTDKLNDALDEHQSIINKVKDAYTDAKGEVEAFRKAVGDATAAELLASRERLQQQLAEKRAATTNVLDPFSSGVLDGIDKPGELDAVNQLARIADAFRENRITAKQFSDQIGELFTRTGDLIDLDVRESFLKQAEAALSAEEAIADTDEALKLVTGSAGEAAKAADTLGIAFDGAGSEQFLTFLDDVNAKLDILRGKIPSMKEELDRLGDLAGIETAYRDAVAAANKLPDGAKRAALAEADRLRTAAISESQIEYLSKQAGTTITAEILRAIVGSEGLRTKAYLDSGNVPTIGYGHTNATGTFPFKMGDVISEQQALDILAADLAVFISQVEALVDVPITDAMKAALVSYNYNTGKLAGSEIIDLLNKGDYAGAQEALRNGINTVNGEFNQGLANRRAEEAALFGSQGLNNAEITGANVERQQRETEALREYNDEFQKRIDNMNFERSIAQMSDRDAAVAEAVRQEELAALEAKTELTAERRAEVERLAGALWDSQNAERMTEEQRAAAMERVNNLLAEREALLNRMAYQQQTGDTAGAAASAAEVAALELQLQEATAAARGMWEGLSGPEAAEALRTIQAAEDGVQRLDTRFTMTGEQWNETIAGSVTSAFSSMAEAIANGENAMQSLGMAFRKIASDILLRLGEMIIQQAVFNALQNAFGGGGGVGGIIAGAAGRILSLHTGGVVGQDGGNPRSFPTSLFANAVRYHDGGIAGLKPGEVPTILKKGEEVLTADDPRHVANGGGAATGGDTTVINAVDPVSFVEAAMKQAPGRKVVLNFLRANQGAVRQALGV